MGTLHDVLDEGLLRAISSLASLMGEKTLTGATVFVDMTEFHCHREACTIALSLLVSSTNHPIDQARVGRFTSRSLGAGDGTAGLFRVRQKVELEHSARLGPWLLMFITTLSLGQRKASIHQSIYPAVGLCVRFQQGKCDGYSQIPQLILFAETCVISHSILSV